MRTFLIDLENVKSQGMVGIESLTEDDRVFIFYSEGANSLSIPIIQAMTNSKAQVEYVHLLKSGRNAMDFQIVALLGFLIGSEKFGHFCIVSQDNGYIAPVEFFMDHPADQLDIQVLLSGSIQKALRKWSNLPDIEEETPDPLEKPVISRIRNHRVHRSNKHINVGAKVEEGAAQSAAPVVEKAAAQPTQSAAPVQPKAAQPTAPVQPKAEKPAATPETVKAEEKPTALTKNGKRRGRPRKNPIVTEGEAKKETTTVKADGKKAAKPVAAKTVKKPVQKAENKPVHQTDAIKAEPMKSPEIKQAPVKNEVKPEEKKDSKPVKTPSKKNIEVPQDLLDRIHGIIAGHVDESQLKYEKIIGQALLSTKAKNEFYQYFRRTLGVQAGGDLYHVIRGDYEKLKASAAVSHRSDEA